MAGIFYLVRHGSTNFNDPAKERLRGWTDVPLSPQGRAEAESAARFLANRGITKIVCSDLSRTRETARLVSRETGVPFSESQRLRDWHYGFMEGLLKVAMQPFMDFFRKYPDLTPPGGEPYRRFWDRFEEAFDALCRFAEAHPTSRVVAVTHSRNIATAKALANGKRDVLDSPNYKRHPNPGGVMEFRVDGKTVTSRQVHGTSGQ